MDSVEMMSLQRPSVPECDNMNKIAEEMEILRGVHMSTRRTKTEYLMLCLIGFGSIERREVLMSVVQWTLESIVLYSAFIKDVSTQEFEAVIITKKQVTMASVEDWLTLFNMGLCYIQFDGYIQSDMVTCISRIHHLGKHWFGTFKSKTAARVRRDFYTQYGKDQRAKELQRVLYVTDMTVTPRNMLLLHDRVTTLQNHINRLERQMQALRSAAREPGSDAAPSPPINLASAYRRLQLSGDASTRIRPLQIPLPAHDTVEQGSPQPSFPTFPSAPPVDSSSEIPPSNATAYPTTFILRPPPTAAVTVILVND
jgi:hypothetical protein